MDNSRQSHAGWEGTRPKLRDFLYEKQVQPHCCEAVAFAVRKQLLFPSSNSKIQMQRGSFCFVFNIKLTVAEASNALPPLKKKKKKDLKHYLQKLAD